jgi:NAD kinase
MEPATENRLVLVTRPTRLQDLVSRFNTVSQARFYVEHLGVDFGDYLREDEAYQAALENVATTLSTLGRAHRLERRFLPNYVFGPNDIIVVLGQDGLVANTLKYLSGQPVLGVNPDPGRWDGQLLPFAPKDLSKVLRELFRGGRKTHRVNMARAVLNDGQQILGVNDLFVGLRSHASARYSIRCGAREERHSSSGIVISTGLGSTGWFKSLVNGATAVVRELAHERGLEDPTGTLVTRPAKKKGRGKRVESAAPFVESAFAWDAPHVFFTVREPFPSRTTGASLVFGRASNDEPLIIESLMPEGGVIFSDGIESDFVAFNSGARATIGLADKIGRLVV